MIKKEIEPRRHEVRKEKSVGARHALPLRMAIIVMLLLSTVFTAQAQEATEEAPPQAVEVEAADGLVLRGNYYPAAENSPSVLLLHQLGSNRESWSPLIPTLLEDGYAVLAVDLRGHGETGGENDWEAATTDVQTWLDWLRAQPGVRANAIAIIGASVGSNLALVGCANDPQCVTAIALSPGSDYFGIQPETALRAGLRRRSALLVSARNDHPSIDGVMELFASATGEIGIQIYNSGIHGTGLFLPYGDSLIPIIMDWLDAHMLQEE